MVDHMTRLRRRPLMAPLLVPILIAVAAGAGVFWLGTWARTTVVILVRHAEPATTSDGDPDLSPAGEQRARGLGEVLSDVLAGDKVDYLYAGDARRAQQTAAPIANQFKLPINLLASSDWDDIAARIRREHRGKTVVVVGYASTLPGVVDRLSATHVALADDEYSAIFVIVIPSPGQTRVLKLRYGDSTRAPLERPKNLGKAL